MLNTVITNNKSVAISLQAREDFKTIFICGDVKEIVFDARNSIYEGWKLLADPLGGRKERANPYLTVIMSKQMEQCEIFWKDILRLEQLLDIYYRNEDYLHGLTITQKSDYMAVDYSLAMSALEKL